MTLTCRSSISASVNTGIDIAMLFNDQWIFKLVLKSVEVNEGGLDGADGETRIPFADTRARSARTFVNASVCLCFIPQRVITRSLGL